MPPDQRLDPSVSDRETPLVARANGPTMALPDQLALIVSA